MRRKFQACIIFLDVTIPCKNICSSLKIEFKAVRDFLSLYSKLFQMFAAFAIAKGIEFLKVENGLLGLFLSLSLSHLPRFCSNGLFPECTLLLFFAKLTKSAREKNNEKRRRERKKEKERKKTRA